MCLLMCILTPCREKALERSVESIVKQKSVRLPDIPGNSLGWYTVNGSEYTKASAFDPCTPLCAVIGATLK